MAAQPIESNADVEGRVLAFLVARLGGTPALERVGIGAEEIEQENGLHGTAKETRARLTIAGIGELHARAERVEHAHAMELKHLAVLDLGQELPEHVGEVARALDDKEVKREPRTGLNECSCAGAKLLLAGVEEPEVVGNRHVVHNPRVARHGSVNQRLDLLPCRVGPGPDTERNRRRLEQPNWNQPRSRRVWTGAHIERHPSTYRVDPSCTSRSIRSTKSSGFT